MSAMSVYVDTYPGGADPFAAYRGGAKGAGFRLAGEGCDDCGDVEGEGAALAGAGLGKGTRKKIVKAIKQHGPKVARAAIGLVGEFGSPGQRDVAANALVASRIVNGAGKAGVVPGCQGAGVALRKLMN
jgi:hypothetical protein